MGRHRVHMVRAQLILALALLLAARLAAGQTTITYTRDAAALARIWVDSRYYDVLGGTKAPKFTGSAVSAAIIRWAPNDNHHMRRPPSWGPNNISVVLTTGDAKWAISKVPYKGGDVKPTYPNIVNSNIRGSNDAVVLDFWVRTKNLPTYPRFSGYVHAASNEGSPDAVKLHGTGPKDRFNLEVNGLILHNRTMERIWSNSAWCDDYCAPPQPGLLMHYYQSMVFHKEGGYPEVMPGMDYRVKLRLADTSDRIVDSALYIHQRGLSIW